MRQPYRPKEELVTPRSRLLLRGAALMLAFHLTWAIGNDLFPANGAPMPSHGSKAKAKKAKGTRFAQWVRPLSQNGLSQNGYGARTLANVDPKSLAWVGKYSSAEAVSTLSLKDARHDCNHLAFEKAQTLHSKKLKLSRSSSMGFYVIKGGVRNHGKLEIRWAMVASSLFVASKLTMSQSRRKPNAKTKSKKKRLIQNTTK